MAIGRITVKDRATARAIALGEAMLPDGVEVVYAFSEGEPHGEPDEYASETTTSKPWNGDASRFTEEQYRRAALVDTGEGSGKSRYKMPVREPDGTLNTRGMTAAAAALAGARGGVKISKALADKARAKLKRLFSAAGVDAPASLTDEDAPEGAYLEMAEAMLASALDDSYDFKLQGADLERFNRLHPRNDQGEFRNKYTGQNREPFDPTKPRIPQNASRAVTAILTMDPEERQGVASADLPSPPSGWTWAEDKTLVPNSFYGSGGGEPDEPVMDLASKVAARNAYNAEQWLRATILDTRERDERMRREESFIPGISTEGRELPVRSPNGTLDPEAMRGASRDLLNSDAPQENVRDAARELLWLFRRIDENPPDSLLGVAGRIERPFREFSDDPEDQAEALAGAPAAAALELAPSSGGAGSGSGASGKNSGRTWTIPKAAKDAARWALEKRKEKGETFGRSGGVKTALYIVGNQQMDEDWARRIRSYFKRHSAQEGEDIANRTTNAGKAGALWGGMTMKRLVYGIPSLAGELEGEAYGFSEDSPDGFVDLSYLTPVLSDTTDAETVEAASGKGSGQGTTKKRKKFWKNLLPIGRKVRYRGRTLSFDQKTADGAVKSFKGGAVDAVPFVMVKDNNAHSDAPELARGLVQDLRVKGKHLQALIEPRTDEAEQFLSNFPEVGVSAKFHPDFYREADNKRFGPTILHAAATWRPHIPKLGLWEQAKKLTAPEPDAAYMFSYDEEVVDLSDGSYEEMTDADKREGGEGGDVKVEVRDGQVVVLDDQGNQLELGEQEREKLSAALSGDNGGGEANDLREQVASLSRAREQDKMEHRLERDYLAKGVPPAFLSAIKPLLFAHAGSDSTVQVVELSEDGKTVAQTKEVAVSDQLWKLADYVRDNHAVEMGERGDASVEGSSNSDADRDKQIRERSREANLSYGDAAQQLAEEGVIG